MDLTTNDFNKLLTNLEIMRDTLDWQSSEPTPAKLLPIVDRSIKLLKGYLDEDEITTEQLELFPEDEEGLDEYDR